MSDQEHTSSEATAEVASDPAEGLRYELATCSYKAFRPEMGLPIRASLGGPRWWKTPIPKEQVMLEIAPHRSYFQAPEEEFHRRFLQQLDRHGVEYLVSRFNHIGDLAPSFPEGGRLVILCFETLTTWDSIECHRGMFRQWWSRRTGQILTELDIHPEVAPRQPGLFDV